jgi:hypothetical protein
MYIVNLMITPINVFIFSVSFQQKIITFWFYISLLSIGWIFISIIIQWLSKNRPWILSQNILFCHSPMNIILKFLPMVNACIAGENAVDASEHGCHVYAVASLTTPIKLSSKVRKEFIKNLDVMSGQLNQGYIT